MKEGPLSLPWSLKVYRAIGGFPINLDPCNPDEHLSSTSTLLVMPVLLLGVLFSATLVVNLLHMGARFDGVGNMEVRAKQTADP